MPIGSPRSVSYTHLKIGRATLDSKELTNLEFYVRNAMKADKEKTFTLIGSADKATGSKELNQRLRYV